MRLILWGVVLASVAAGAAPAQEHEPGGARARNVILMIGDGMGLAQITLARLAAGDSPERPLFMETLPVEGFCTTHSADHLVTDSAAAATAFATGRKVANGVISLHPNGKPIRTVLEAARARGLATGLVTTTTITHATPAAFASHVPARAAESQIARQYLESGVDVLLGGGRKFFDDDAVAAFRARGYQFVEDRQALAGAKADRILGLFSRSHMSYELDRAATSEPSLEDMTARALEILSSRPDPDGFFLMVEGGRIDHAGHEHDAASCVAEVLSFDRAVRLAAAWAARHGETLLIVTADHTSGGLAISERIDVRALRAVKSSGEGMAARVKKGEPVADVLAEAAGFVPTSEELAEIPVPRNRSVSEMRIAHLVSHRLGVEYYTLEEQGTHHSTKGHDGSAVPVYALGPGSDALDRLIDNTEVAERIAAALGLEMRR